MWWLESLNDPFTYLVFFFGSLSLILIQQALLWQTFFLRLYGLFARFLLEAYWCELSTLLFWLWSKINKRWIERLWRRDKRAQRWHTWFTITKNSAIKRLKTHFEEIAIYSTIALNWTHKYLRNSAIFMRFHLLLHTNRYVATQWRSKQFPREELLGLPSPLGKCLHAS